MKLSSGTSVLSAQAAFDATGQVQYTEPDYKICIAAVPNDTSFNLLWGMHNQGQTGGITDADIDAPEAWDVAIGDVSCQSSGVTGACGNVPVCTATVSSANLTSGSWYIAIQAYDSLGNMSGYSNEVVGTLSL